MQQNSKKIINLGGGGVISDEMLCADTSPRADVYVDLTKDLPFPDSSVDAIFCEEVVEHLDLSDATLLFRECLRVLRPGGVMRISTPDISYFFNATVDFGWTENETLLKASQTIARNVDLSRRGYGLCLLNSIFYDHGHRFIFDERVLGEIVSSAGFVNVQRSYFRDRDSRLGRFDSHAERFLHPPEISIFLEFEKPA